MDLNEFYLEIIDEVTISGSLPLFIPEREVERITKRAAKWFWKYYQYATQDAYVIVKENVFRDQRIKENRKIIMPESVEAVFGCHLVNNLNSLWTTISPQSMGYGVGGTDTFSSENVLFWLSMEMKRDVLKQNFKRSIKFTFNQNNKELTFLGTMPGTHAVFETLKRIELEALCNDEMFFEWVAATIKSQISRLLNTFKMPVVGNADINANAIKQEGEESMQRIRDEISNMSSDGWFVVR